MKNLVKAMNREGQFFKYLRDKFSTLTDAKVKEDHQLKKYPAFNLVLEREA